MVFIEIFKIHYVGGRGVSIRALPTCGGAKAFLLIEDILSLPLGGGGPSKIPASKRRVDYAVDEGGRCGWDRLRWIILSLPLS